MRSRNSTHTIRPLSLSQLTWPLVRVSCRVWHQRVYSPQEIRNLHMGRSCMGTLSRVLMGQMLLAVEWNTLHCTFMVRILMECTTQMCMRKWAGEINQGEDCCYTVGGGIVRTFILHSEKKNSNKDCRSWKTEVSFRSTSSWDRGRKCVHVQCKSHCKWRVL